MSQEIACNEASETPGSVEAKATDSRSEDGNTNHQRAEEMLGSFPPEIAMLLIVAGVAGVVLPGPIGAPLLLAGGVVFWPKTFRPIETWFSRRFPSVHREGVIQLKEFLKDLNRRFPEPPASPNADPPANEGADKSSECDKSSAA